MDLGDEALLDMDSLADDGSDDEGDAPVSSGPASTPTSSTSSPPQGVEEPSSPHSSWASGLFGTGSFFGNSSITNNPFGRLSFSSTRRGPGRPRKEGIKPIRDGKVARKYRANHNPNRGFKMKHRASRDDSLEDLFEEEAQLLLASTAAEEPPYFLEKWPGKVCALCNLGERSQLGQGEMQRIVCTSVPEITSPPYTPLAPGPTEGSTTPTSGALPPAQTFRRQKSLYKCKVPSTNPEHTDELSIIGYPENADISLITENGFIYIHKNCLDWSSPVELKASAPSTPSSEERPSSPGSKDDNKESKESDEAASAIISVALHKKCSFCQRFGASISCKMSCNKYFHYPCVLASGGFQQVLVRASFCKDHVYQVPLVCPSGVECHTCGVIGDMANLMTCCTCNSHHHGTCVGLSQLPGVRAGWNCKQCRICQVCHSGGSDSGDSRSIACEQCDKLYHVACIRPMMATVPKYGWKCKCCRVCSDCGSRSPGAGASSRWHAHYTVCDSCYQQRNKGLSCPICRRAYRAAHQREMVQCTQCKKFVHGTCDPDAELITYQMKKESIPEYEYACPVCLTAGALIQKRKDSVDEESLSASQESLFEDISMEQDPLDTSKMSIGLGKGKPFSASSKIAKKKLGVFKFKSGYGNSAGKLALSKRQKSIDLSRRRGSKSKMLGVFGVPGQGLQRPQPQDKEGEEEPGEENKLVLCSSKDKFVLSQDLCVMCGALGTDSEGCLIACAQCGQTYHPYCVSIKVSAVIVLKGWRCLDCTVCEGCGQRDDAARLVLCDDCDVSYHTYCAQPSLPAVPRGCWRCTRCRRCQTCGTTDPGSDANWSNGYTECGPCASLVMCSVCAAPYSDGELIMQCSQCRRWLHGACDTILNEQEADVCCQKGYTCLLCRPPEAPPPHLIPSPCPTPTPPPAPPLPPPQPPVVQQRPPSPCGEFYLDGVCLSAGGMRAMRSLQGDLAASQGGIFGQRKKRRLKGGVLSAMGSVVQGGDCEGDDKLDGVDIKEEPGLSQYKEGMMWNVSQDGPIPEGFTTYTTESGVTVLRKKRQRNLNRVGIGGFSVRVRAQGNRTPTPAESEPATTPTTPTGSSLSESPSMSKKKQRRKPRSRLMETFPSYMQEAFFGRDLLEIQTGSESKEALHSDSDGEQPPLSPTIQLNEEELQAIEAVRSKVEKEKEERDKANEVKLEKMKTEGDSMESGQPHMDDTKALNEGVMQHTPLNNVSGPLMSVQPSASGGLQPIPVDQSLKDVSLKGPNVDLAANITNKEDLSLFANIESMVRESLPNMDSRDVEEIFKGVLTDDSQESQESAVSFVNSVNGSNNFNTPRQHLSSPIEFPSPFHNEYNSGNSQLSPAYSENSGPWMGTQQDTIDSSVPQQSLMQPSHTSTYNQRSTEKMKADESLGSEATISAVLYANMNHPEWKTEFPNWPDRCKQILKKWRALPSDKKTPYLQKARDNRGAIRMKKARQISKEETCTTTTTEILCEAKTPEQPSSAGKAQAPPPASEVPHHHNKDGLTPPTNQTTTSTSTPVPSTTPPVTRTNSNSSSSVVTLHHGFTPFYHGSEGPAPNVTVNPFGKFTLAGHKSAASVGVGVVQRSPSPLGDPHIRVLTPSEIMRTLPSLPQELALETTSRTTEQEKVAGGQRGAREAEQERQWKLLQQLRQQQAQHQQQVIHDQRMQAMARVQRHGMSDSPFPDGQLQVAVNEQSPLHSVASPSPTLPRSPYPPGARYPHPLLVQVRPPVPTVQRSVRSPFSPQSPHDQFPGSVSPAQSQGDPFQRPPSENSGDYMHSPQTPRSFGHQSPNPARSPAYVGQTRMVPVVNQDVFVPTPGTPRPNAQYAVTPQRNQIYAPRPQDPFLPGQSQTLSSPRSETPVHQPMEVNRQLRDLLQRQQAPNKLWQGEEQNMLNQGPGQMIIQQNQVQQISQQQQQQQQVAMGVGNAEGSLSQQPDGQFRQPLPVSPVIRQRPPLPNTPMDARTRFVLQQPPVGVNAVQGVQNQQIQQRLMSPHQVPHQQIVRTRPPILLDHNTLQQAQKPATLHHIVQGKKVVQVNSGGPGSQQQVQVQGQAISQSAQSVGNNQIQVSASSVESAVVVVAASEEKQQQPISSNPATSTTQEDVPDVDIDKLEHDTANMAEVGDLLGGLDDDEELLVSLTAEMGDDFNILEYADPELADFGDTSNILDGLELAEEDPTTVGQHTKRDIIDEPHDNKSELIKVEPNLIKSEKKEEGTMDSDTKIKVEPGMEGDNVNMGATSGDQQQMQLQQPKQEVIEGEMVSHQDIVLPRLDLIQQSHQSQQPGAILTQGQQIRFQQFRTEQGMQQQAPQGQMQGQPAQGQIPQSVYTAFTQRVGQRPIGQIVNINQQGQISQLSIHKQAVNPGQQQIITQGQQQVVRQGDPNQAMDQGGKPLQFAPGPQQIRGHFNPQGKPFSQVIQPQHQQQNNSVVQQMQSQVNATLAMGRPMAPGTKLMSPDGAVGVVTHNNTVTLTYPPHYLNRAPHQGQMGVRGVVRPTQATPPPPPPYPGPGARMLTPPSGQNASLPPPPPPYPSQVCGLDYGADPWSSDWLRRRPLLLQEQPLLLEDLLEQEKREQGGVGEVGALPNPTNPPQHWQQPATNPPPPQQPTVGTVPLFNAPTLPAPPLPPERIITDADRQAHMVYEQWLQQQNVVLTNQLKYYDTEVQKLRKIRKSLNSKQRQLRKSGNGLAPADATELLRVSGEQAILQKHLEAARKQSRQHTMLIQEYRNKHQPQQPQIQQPSPGGMGQQQGVFSQQQQQQHVVGNISRMSPQGGQISQQNQTQFTQNNLMNQQQRVNQLIQQSQQNQLQGKTQMNIQNQQQQQLQNSEIQTHQQLQEHMQNQQLQNQQNQHMQNQLMQNQQNLNMQNQQGHHMQQNQQNQHLQNQQNNPNMKIHLQQIQSQAQNRSSPQTSQVHNEIQNQLHSSQQQLQNAQIQQIQQQLMSSQPSPQMSNVTLQNQQQHIVNPQQDRILQQHMQQQIVSPGQNPQHQIMNASPQHPIVSPGPQQHSIMSPGPQQHSIVSPGPQQHSIVSPGPQQHSIVSPGPQQHSIVSPGPQQHSIVSPGPQQHSIVSPGPQQHPIVSPGPQQHPIVSPQHSIVSPGNQHQIISSSSQHQMVSQGSQQQIINASPQHQMVSPGPQQHSIVSPGPQQHSIVSPGPQQHSIVSPGPHQHQQQILNSHHMVSPGQQVIGHQRHLVSPGPNQMIINSQHHQIVSPGGQQHQIQQNQRPISTPSPQMGIQMQNMHSPVTSSSPQLQPVQGGGASPLGASGTPPPPFSPQSGARSPQVMFPRPPSQAPQPRFARPPQHHNMHHQGMRVQFGNRQSSPLGSPQPLMSPGASDALSRQQMLQRQQYSPMGQPPSSPMSRSPLVGSVPSPSPPQTSGSGGGGGGGNSQVAPLPPGLGRYRYFKLGLRGGSPIWGLNKPPIKPDPPPTQGTSHQNMTDPSQVPKPKKEPHISKVSILKKKPSIKISTAGGAVQMSNIKTPSLVINSTDLSETEDHTVTPPTSPGKIMHSVEINKTSKSPIKTVKVIEKKTAESIQQEDEEVFLIDSSPDENKHNILDYDDESDKTFVGAEVSLCATAGDSDHGELSMVEEGFPAEEICDSAGSPLDQQEYVLFSTDTDYNVDSDDSLKQISFIQKDNGVVLSYSRQTPESNGEGNVHSPAEVSEDESAPMQAEEDVNVKPPYSPVARDNAESAIVLIRSNTSPEEHIATTEEDFEELIDSGKPEDTVEEDTNKKASVEKTPTPVTTAESQPTTITRTETTKKTVAVISLGSKTPQSANVQQIKLVNAGKAPSGITRLPLISNNLMISPSSNTKILNEVSQATVASVSIANQTISVPVLKSLNVPINQIASSGQTASVSHIKKVPITKSISSVISVISSNIPRVATLSPVITLATTSAATASRMPIPILTPQHIKQKFIQNMEKTTSLPSTNISSVTQDTTLPANIFQDDSASPDNSSQEDNNETNKDTGVGSSDKSIHSSNTSDGNQNLKAQSSNTSPPAVSSASMTMEVSSYLNHKAKSDVDIESEISTHTELPPKIIESIVMSKSDSLSKPPERVPETIPDNIMEGDDDDKMSVKSPEAEIDSKQDEDVKDDSDDNNIDASQLTAIKTVENDSKESMLESNIRMTSDTSQESIHISIPSPTPSQEQYLDSISLTEHESDISTIGNQKVESIEEMLDMLKRDSKSFPIKVRDHTDSSQESTSTMDKEQDSMSDLDDIITKDLNSGVHSSESMQESSKPTIPVHVIKRSRESSPITVATSRVTTIMPQLSPLSKPAELTSNIANVSQQLRTIMSSLNTTKVETSVSSTIKKVVGHQEANQSSQVNYENLLPSTKVEVLAGKSSNRGLIEKAVMNSINLPDTSSNSPVTRINTMVSSNSGILRNQPSPHGSPSNSPRHSPLLSCKSPVQSPLITSQPTMEELTQTQQQIVQMPALSKIQPGGGQAIPSVIQANLQTSSSPTLHKTLISTNILSSTLMQSARPGNTIQVSLQNISSSQPPALIMTRPIVSIHSQHLQASNLGLGQPIVSKVQMGNSSNISTSKLLHSQLTSPLKRSKSTDEPKREVVVGPIQPTKRHSLESVIVKSEPMECDDSSGPHGLESHGSKNAVHCMQQKTDDSQNVLLKKLLQNSGVSSPVTPRTVTSLLAGQRTAPSLGIVPSLEAQLARPPILPGHMPLTSTVDPPKSSPRPIVVTRETTFISRASIPSVCSSVVTTSSTAAVHSALMDIRKPLTKTVGREESPVGLRDNTNVPTPPTTPISLPTSTPSAFSLISTEIAAQNIKKEVLPPQQSPVLQQQQQQQPQPFIPQEIKRELIDESSQQSTISAVSAMSDQGKPEIKEEITDIPPSADTSTESSVGIIQETPLEAKKRKRREYQQKRRLMQMNQQKAEANNNANNNVLNNNNVNNKKKPRKASKVEEDYDTFIDNLMVQLRQLQPIQVQEPLLGKNYGVCPAVGTGDLAKAISNKDYNFKFGDLCGDFGNAKIPNIGDFYNTKPFGEDEPIPEKPPASTQRGFYDQEFPPIRLDIDSDDKKIEFLCRERDVNTPDTIISSSSPECSLWDDPHPYPGLRLIDEDSDSDDENARSTSPVIQLIAPVPIRVKPIVSPSIADSMSSDNDKENVCINSNNKEMVAPKTNKVFAPGSESDNNNDNVTVTLTLTSGAAEDILGVLKKLAGYLHIPPPTAYQIVERTATPPSHRLGLYRIKGKDGKEGTPIDIQSILNGTAKFCRHCDVVILDSVIRAKASEFPLLTSTKTNNDMLNDVDSELYFCSTQCYQRFAWRPTNILIDNKMKQFDDDKNLVPLLDMKEKDEMDTASAESMETDDLDIKPDTDKMDFLFSDSLGDDLMKQENDNCVKDLKTKLKEDRSGPPTKQFKGQQYKQWSPGCIVPPTKYRKPTDRELTELVFRTGVALTPVKMPEDYRRCVLCHTQGDGVADGPSRLLNYDVDKWVHLNCALWSEGVYETVNGALMHFETALQAGMSTACAFCKKTGATVKCFKTRCSNVYHLSCAVKDSCVFHKDKTTHCVSHAPKGEKENELTTLSVQRRVYVQRDESRQVAAVMQLADSTHLLRVGGLIFLSVGQLLPHQLATHHTPNFIYPVGYKIIRFYWSMKKFNTRCCYICQIDDAGGRPEFIVSCQEDGPAAGISGNSTPGQLEWRGPTPRAAWGPVLDALEQLRKENDCLRLWPDYITGEDLFGLTEPAIVRVLESLPGIDSLTDYRFKYGRNPLLELPLAVNPSGAARTEARSLVKGVAWRRALGVRAPHPHPTPARPSLPPPLAPPPPPPPPGEHACPYSKQFVHSKSSQYKKMKQEWRNNVYLARSKIQGLGLYAARDLEKHTMVIEYIGEVIRHELSEIREKKYEASNRGIYMFRLDEDRVVDATLCGGLARYINHSCNPNCVAEAVEVERDTRIIIFAKRRILRGEELAYDYKFDIEDDAHKISCMCGAPNCRKWMN